MSSGPGQGGMQVGARFGRAGAALVTGFTLLITYFIVHAAISSWSSSLFE